MIRHLIRAILYLALFVSWHHTFWLIADLIGILTIEATSFFAWRPSPMDISQLRQAYLDGKLLLKIEELHDLVEARDKVRANYGLLCEMNQTDYIADLRSLYTEMDIQLSVAIAVHPDSPTPLALTIQ